MCISIDSNALCSAWTISQILERSPKQLLGKLAPPFRRFPRLLKFLDEREILSVHSDRGIRMEVEWRRNVE